MQTENEIAILDRLKAEITLFVQPVKGIKVIDAASNAVAAGSLRTVKEFMRQVEAKRVDFVKPLNDKVKAVNRYADEICGPLVDAERFIKETMGDFAKAENDRRAAEAKRIEDERRASEAKAQQEAAQAARLAEAKAEDDRKRLAAEQDRERQSLLSKQKKEAEVAKMFGVDTEQQKIEAESARKSLEAKAEAQRRQAAANAEADRLAEEARVRREHEERQRELREKERALESSRMKNTRQVPVWKVTDEAQVPEEYWKINVELLGAQIRGGKRNIPGIEIRMETQVVAR